MWDSRPGIPTKTTQRHSRIVCMEEDWETGTAFTSSPPPTTVRPTRLRGFHVPRWRCSNGALLCGAKLSPAKTLCPAPIHLHLHLSLLALRRPGAWASQYAGPLCGRRTPQSSAHGPHRAPLRPRKRRQPPPRTPHPSARNSPQRSERSRPTTPVRAQRSYAVLRHALHRAGPLRSPTLRHLAREGQMLPSASAAVRRDQRSAASSSTDLSLPTIPRQRRVGNDKSSPPAAQRRHTAEGFPPAPQAGPPPTERELSLDPAGAGCRARCRAGLSRVQSWGAHDDLPKESRRLIRTEPGAEPGAERAISRVQSWGAHDILLQRRAAHPEARK